MKVGAAAVVVAAAMAALNKVVESGETFTVESH
jgi:hypothetical protein